MPVPGQSTKEVAAGSALSTALILTTAVLFCLPGAPSAPGCLAASGRQARLRQAAAGAPASLRRTRWRGFGLPLRSDA
ncbi:hypothetical protein ACSGYW_004958 [Escherichia coli]